MAVMPRAPHKKSVPRESPAPPLPSLPARPSGRRRQWAVVAVCLLVAVGVRLWATAGVRQWRYERQPIEALQAAAEMRPGDPVLRLALGRKLLAAGRADEAAPEFRRAATLDPQSAEALAGLGAALAAAGHEGDAFGALQLSLNRRPTPE